MKTSFHVYPQVRENNPLHGGDRGMTLREYYAGQCLEALISRGCDIVDPSSIAKKAITLAEALIHELERKA